jgi:hypothetical protein
MVRGNLKLLISHHSKVILAVTIAYLFEGILAKLNTILAKWYDK